MKELMERRSPRRIGLVWIGICLLGVSLEGAQTFSVATFNLNNYLTTPSGTRAIKTPEAKDKISQLIRAAQADILALQELGSRAALDELCSSLAADGLVYPHQEFARGFDTNIHVAILSRFPISARRPHTNETFLLFGRRFQVSRGFAEVDIRVSPRYSCTVITAHLKSKREVGYADQAELREEEAKALRRLVDQRLNLNPALNLIVLGDFNDNKDSPTLRTLMGRGRNRLIDTRPAERNGDDFLLTAPGRPRRQIVWTHFFEKEDTYSRLDYILLSPNMAREWRQDQTFVVAMPNWGLGSDHRPIVAGFFAEDR